MSALLPSDILRPHERNIPDPDTWFRLTMIGNSNIESGWGATTHKVSSAKCPIASWRRADLSTRRCAAPITPERFELFFAMPRALRNGGVVAPGFQSRYRWMQYEALVTRAASRRSTRLAILDAGGEGAPFLASEEQSDVQDDPG
jgi:hypothetical protein